MKVLFLVLLLTLACVANATELTDWYGCTKDLYQLVDHLIAFWGHVQQWKEEIIVEDLYVLLQVLTKLVQDCQ